MFKRREKGGLTNKRGFNNTDQNVIYFSIPFTGKHALQLRTQLTKLCSSAFLPLSLRIIFQSARRLFDFFPFKDRTHKLLRSRVVYKFTCQCAEHCMWARLGATSIHASQNIWETGLWWERNERQPRHPVFTNVVMKQEIALVDCS